MRLRMYFVVKPNPDMLKVLKDASDDDRLLLGESRLWAYPEDDGLYNSTDYIEQVKLLFLIDLKHWYLDGNSSSDFTRLVEHFLGSPPFTVRSFDRWWLIERFELQEDFEAVEAALTL